MPRLNPDHLQRARDLIALYPEPRSALIPILHVLQEQDGYLTEDGMEHVAELLGLQAVEVQGTASFYDMFHFEPVGKYLVAVCTNIACMLQGAYRLLEHIEDKLGVAPGGTTADGLFTLEDAECLALCGNAPCLTVNWRYFGDVDPEGFNTLVEELKSGRLDGEIPPHGTLSRIRRTVGLEAVRTGAVDGSRPALKVAARKAPVPTIESGDSPSAASTDGAGDAAPAKKRTVRKSTKITKATQAALDRVPPGAVGGAGAAVDIANHRSTAATSSMEAAHVEGRS